MRRSSSSIFNHLSALLAALATALAAGCATTSPPLPDESQLLAAGFKVVVARTPEQQQHLQSLPAGKVTEWQRTGKHYFIYPDAAQKRIYVGTPKEYETYLRLVPGAAAPSLAQQQAADIASYNKQDAAMQMYTARDLADPYYFWESFDGLGFR